MFFQSHAFRRREASDYRRAEAGTGRADSHGLTHRARGAGRARGRRKSQFASLNVRKFLVAPPEQMHLHLVRLSSCLVYPGLDIAMNNVMRHA